MQTWWSCKRSYEALTLRVKVLDREHISRESSVRTWEMSNHFDSSEKLEIREEVLHSYQLPQRWRGTLNFHWLQQTSITNQVVFIVFFFSSLRHGITVINQTRVEYITSLYCPQKNCQWEYICNQYNHQYVLRFKYKIKNNLRFQCCTVFWMAGMRKASLSDINSHFCFIDKGLGKLLVVTRV